MTLEDFGWNPFFSTAFHSAADPENIPGRVCAAHRGLYVVFTASGEIDAEPSGRMRHTASRPSEWPAVGDWVVLRAGSNRIDGVLPRRTCFSRKQPGLVTEEQVLAANIDIVLLVAGLDHDFNLRRIERTLVLAAESGAEPLIVLNKADLCTDPSPFVAATEAVSGGVPVAAVSALTGAKLDELTCRLKPGRTAALIGSSGAGKSTLLNRLVGRDVQRVQPVREHDNRGRHTTTHRRLIRTPAGWLLMDMPGIRELQLWAGPDPIDGLFSDIASLAAGCRFRDCTHKGEPGCAVLSAVEQGALDQARLCSYEKMTQELDYLERKQDQRAAIENKRRWKQLHKAARKLTYRW